ncbi:MAG: hypothetical protein NC916_02030 [Candidatus Omnitrophica bacterium]|nr:hypothetical protein [Candidatus Omnitrophota bacterium]
MKKKTPITIIETRNLYTDFKIFKVSLETLELIEYTTFDLLSFNNEGYLIRLLENFKEEGKVCFLLFSALTWHTAIKGAAVTNNVRKAVENAYTYFTINSVSPSCGMLQKRLGKDVYLLVLKDKNLVRTQKILEDIDSKGTWCYFMFDYESKKDSLYDEVERFYKNDMLGEKRSMLSLGLETIKFGSGGFWECYEFEIYTRRFNKNRIKDLILNSIEADKFEVIVK